MVKRIFPWLMMGYALWQWNQRRRRPDTAQRTDGNVKPAAVSQWEGEGGALRDAVTSTTA